MTTETATAVAETVADSTAATVEHVIDAAVERAERAEETAEQIALSAFEGERARRIDALETGIAECRSTLDQLTTSLPLQMREEMQAMLETLTAGLASANADALANLETKLVAMLPSSTLAPPQVEEPETIVEEITPVPEVPNAPIARQKRHRFL